MVIPARGACTRWPPTINRKPKIARQGCQLFVRFSFFFFLCLQLELGIEVSVPCSSMHGVEFVTFVCRICPSTYTTKRDLMTVLILFKNCATFASQEPKIRSCFFFLCFLLAVIGYCIVSRSVQGMNRDKSTKCYRWFSYLRHHKRFCHLFFWPWTVFEL